MKVNKLVSIIIRTKNEERWITQCLESVMRQRYKNFEVIIVDNESSDKTIEKARQFKVRKILSCKGYLPGKALNIGIRESRGAYIACLSGHCIPVAEDWLGSLVGNFTGTDIAGVYGRQEPMSFTPDSDKRDLALIFGLDRKVQTKDSFFHNANSIIRRDIWNKIPFDEKLTNIEDRAWAKAVLQRGYKVVYEPAGSVYHYHGIHQNGNAGRLANVVRILESLHTDYSYKSIDVNKLNTVCIIPVKGPMRYLKNKPLIAYTIEHALKSKYIKRTIVSTDNKNVAALAKKLGAEAPFLRDRSLSSEMVDIVQVFKYSLMKIEELGIFPDLVCTLEITFPFRPKGLVDNMILELARNGFDSVVAARKENKGIWKQSDGEMAQLDEGMTPRRFKDPTIVELRGIGCVTHPEFIRNGTLFGRKIGMHELNNPYSHIEVRNKEDFEMAAALIEKWFKAKKRPG